MTNIIILEDEANIAENLRKYLSVKLEHNILTAGSIEELHSLLFNLSDVELFLLDVNLPDGVTLDSLNELRAKYPNAQILIMTGITDDQKQVEAFDLGADDFIQKPFSLEALTARIQKRLKDNEKSHNSNKKRFDICVKKQIIFTDSTSVGLTEKETAILEQLVSKSPVAVSREEIAQKLRKQHFNVKTDRSVDMGINAINKKISKLGVDGKSIFSVRGIGYRLELH